MTCWLPPLKNSERKPYLTLRSVLRVCTGVHHWITKKAFSGGMVPRIHI